MIKVIGKTDTHMYPKRIRCPNCESVLEYYGTDIEYDWSGCPYIMCPECENKVDLSDKEEEISRTPEELEFPKHFYRINAASGSMPVENDTINEWVRSCIRCLRSDPDKKESTISSGDTTVTVMRIPGFKGDSGSYEVHVIKDDYVSTCGEKAGDNNAG